MNQTLLLEIGTEELPPKALLRLANVFREKLLEGLAESGLAMGKAQVYATPRRLAVAIAEVADSAPDQHIEKLGPALDKAFDPKGQATAAASGFARSCGVAVEDLQQRNTSKGQRLAYRGTEPGKALSTLLPSIITDALKALPIPKRMRWGNLDAAFVRPVHSVVALHGSDVLPLTLFGCVAGRSTQGHRFHCPKPIELPNASSYAKLLRNPGYIIADFDERRALVRDQVVVAAKKKGGMALIDEALLDEVTALVEWPVALAGDFGEEFLQLPPEVLVATLQGHQRYFPVAADDGKLLACFVTVANIESKDPAQVIAGNERVVKPRLSDALFFWQTDRRRGLESYVSELAEVSFVHALGSVADKSVRVAKLAVSLAATLGVDSVSVARAATLAKADLLSEMVGEFPELQGIMGRYYAQAENPAVAQALQEQYAPRHSGTTIPKSDVGQVLAIADKLDTLAGIFSIGKRPSGDKDPYALRRAGLGLLRILIEAELDIDLKVTLEQAVNNQPVDSDHAAVAADLTQFLLDRLRGYLAEQGVAPGVFEAVAALGLGNPYDFSRRVQAVQAFLDAPEAQQLCATHKRIRNILKNAEALPELDPDLLSEAAEIALFTTLQKLQTTVKKLTQATEYASALLTLAGLQRPVEAFFEHVLVMDKNVAIRSNRLALLAALDHMCQQIADISKLAVD